MPAYPTEREIRTALIARVTDFCRVKGIKPRGLCQQAINDPNFFNKVTSGGNFTLRTYQRLNRYMDRHAPKAATKQHRNGGG